MHPQIPTEGVPALLAESLPVHAWVPVDVFVTGCPPSADRIFEVILGLLDGQSSRGRPECHGSDEARGAIVSEIVIEPVTRIEGHAKITVFLDEAGEVKDAHFHVTQFRGFERIAQGRPVHEMPSLMARICGICPVSHLVASAKACDEILGVSVPPVAVRLRRVMNLAQIVQSHSLSFFHLSSPDLLLGFDHDPASRNILGVAERAPETGSRRHRRP